MDILIISCIRGLPALWHAKHNYKQNTEGLANETTESNTANLQMVDGSNKYIQKNQTTVRTRLNFLAGIQASMRSCTQQDLVCFQYY